MTISWAIVTQYHMRVTARPVKARFGRCGTCVRETIHLQYMPTTDGTGMTNTRPIQSTRVRQVNSQIPSSIESGPPPRPPALSNGPPGCGTAGGLELPENRPGISPAFCQPAMPSLQTSVSAVIVPAAMNSCNRASGYGPCCWPWDAKNHDRFDISAPLMRASTGG